MCRPKRLSFWARILLTGALAVTSVLLVRAERRGRRDVEEHRPRPEHDAGEVAAGVRHEVHAEARPGHGVWSSQVS